MKTNKQIALIAVSLILTLALFRVGTANAQIDPANVGNGWYTNLPPVTIEEVNEKIACLVKAGAPEGPELIAEELSALPHDLKFGPTQIKWSKAGKSIMTDAVLTRYGPRVAWVEIAHVFKLNVNAPVFCPDAVPLVKIKNPVGKARPDWCDKCYESIGDADDKFEIGAVFTSATGTYAKERRFWAFFAFSRWVKLGD